MEIRNPKNREELLIRDRLLQQTLRHEFNPSFAIKDEYPLLLSHDDSNKSWLAIDESEIIAHLNIFKRTLIHKSQVIRIALLANLATHPDKQGKGYMTQLVQFAENHLQQENIDIAILWSELDSFYEKKGYQKIGSEQRLLFLKEKLLSKKLFSNTSWTKVLSPTKPLVKKLLSLKTSLLFEVERSVDDFFKILNTPATFLFVCSNAQQPTAYMICGRGCDMQNVVHEWHVPDDLTLVSGLQFICENEFVVLLAPTYQDFSETVLELTTNREYHPMAFAKFLNKTISQPLQKELTEKLFFWGIDSM